MKKIVPATILFLVLLEFGLRATGIYKVYSERLGEKYKSSWNYQHKGHYKVLPRNERIFYKQKELEIEFYTNQFGMRNPEISITPKDSTIRILCMGDSFTEGDGVPYGFSYPRYLESLINKHSAIKYEVVNAGKNGSDIIYMEKKFTEKLHNLRPQLLLLAINATDIDDIIQRGGPERFKSDYSTQFRKGPWYETYYAKSHVLRFITHFVLRKSKLFLGPHAEKREIKNSNAIIESSMERVKSFCDQNGIKLRFIIHPLPSYSRVSKKQMNKKNKLSVQESFQEEGLIYNLIESLTSSYRKLEYSDYAWQINGHYNRKGYKMMAEEIFNQMASESISLDYYYNPNR